MVQTGGRGSHAFYASAPPRLTSPPPARIFARSRRAVSSAVEHCLHTAGVTSSILVPPTTESKTKGPASPGPSSFRVRRQAPRTFGASHCHRMRHADRHFNFPSFKRLVPDGGESRPGAGGGGRIHHTKSGIAVAANSKRGEKYVSKLNLRPLPLALACLLAPFHQAFATGTSTSTSIPLDLIQENYGGGQYGYRLGINVGVNGATPVEYLFDTGSDSFNIDVGAGNNGHAPAWFPNQPGVAQSAPYAYLYGNGTYGYWQTSTTVASLQFYNSTTGAQAASYATAQGLPVATAVDWMVTPQSAGGDTLGPAVTTQGGVTLYQDLTWQQNLDQGNPPEEGLFYGTFGAGDFGNGVPGMLTGSGYIVEANGTGKAPGACAQACLIMGLTPALRAQFLSVVPWLPTQGQTSPFPLSGAPSAYQFDTAFLYTLTSGGKSVSAPMMTLFDTGTPNIMLIDNGDLGLANAEQAAGNINANGNLVPGVTLTATGLAVTANGLVISGLP